MESVYSSFENSNVTKLNYGKSKHLRKNTVYSNDLNSNNQGQGGF